MSETQIQVPDVAENAKVESPTAASNQTGDSTESSPVIISPDIQFENAPAQYIQTRFQSIILWEKPVKSGLALVMSLGFLILTQFYSLLQIFAALATLVIGVNWVYVNAYVQGQRFIASKPANEVVNPHKARIQAVPKALVSRDRIVHASNLLVDVVEAVAAEATKIVLIEDNFRSLRYFGISFTVWTVAKYLPTKWIVGVGILLAFSIPRLYLQHQEKIDSHLAQSSERAKVLASQYSEFAKQTASGVYNQARNAAATRRSGPSKKKSQ